MIVYVNDSISIAVQIQIEGTPITTSYNTGDIMNNPALDYGICRATVFTSTGDSDGCTDGSTYFRDYLHKKDWCRPDWNNEEWNDYWLCRNWEYNDGPFTAQMVGQNIAVSQYGVFLGYFTIASYVNPCSITLETYPSAAEGLTWALVASSNGVSVQDLLCYRDSTISGQGDLIISYGFQLPDKYTIVPVYGVHTSSGALNWHQQAKQTVRVNALTTDAGGVVVANMPS